MSRILDLIIRGRSKSQDRGQSVNMIGSNNTVNQIRIYGNSDQAGHQDITGADLHIIDRLNATASIDKLESSGNDSDDVRRVSTYRKIADEGDSATALKLLNALSTEEQFQQGQGAFRLHFNIAVINLNIGEYDQAIRSFRSAHKFADGNLKAEAGLAFADLLAGRDREALNRSLELLRQSGDHRPLAAVIAYNSARRLDVELDLGEYAELEEENPDVVTARLEYLAARDPKALPDTLQQALAHDPDNARLRSIWALTILSDVEKNQAFLLGKHMPTDFNRDIEEAASILVAEFEASLKQRPLNKILFPSQANNAALALRMAGKASQSADLLDRALAEAPDAIEDLAQLRAALFLQQENDDAAFKLIEGIKHRPDLQVMASQIEAKLGNYQKALERISQALDLAMPTELRLHALSTKARIAIGASQRAAADEAIEDIVANYADTPERIVIKSAYDRAFELHKEELEPQLSLETSSGKSKQDVELIEALKDAGDWAFSDILQTAEELFSRELYRDCCELLRPHVSLSRESPALYLLTDSCLRGGMGALAKGLADELSESIRNTPFGQKFRANVGFLTGNIAPTVPLTRKMFSDNPNSLAALQWYIQSLLRMNDRNRIVRVVRELNDDEMVGSIQDKHEYALLLVFCDEISRARNYAYRLFCENQNDHQAWMALSASVLALGSSPSKEKELQADVAEDGVAISVRLPDGQTRNYILESDHRVFGLRGENIGLDHPIARAVVGRRPGETFAWPLDALAGDAKLVDVKPKILEAFHFVIQRFEEKFPGASGFTSVRCDPSREDGLDEIKELLRQRANYGKKKAQEYVDNSLPLSTLGYQLGLDSIDTYLGLYRDCGVNIATSSCLPNDQKSAASYLVEARKSGLLLDALSVYLLRRLNLTSELVAEFGDLGVTQSTFDTIAQRAQEAERMGGYDDNGVRKSGHMALRNGQLYLSELSEEEISSRIRLAVDDAAWVEKFCKVVPAVAASDPPDEILRFRTEEFGRFLDDLFACNGSGRILISDDMHLRNWGAGLLEVKSAWIQSLIFHLESADRIAPEKVVSSTIALLEAGEAALSFSSERMIVAANMLHRGDISDEQFQTLCSIFGQPGADIKSHATAALKFINEMWADGSLLPIRERATSYILRKLIRNLGGNSGTLVDEMIAAMGSGPAKQYITIWRIGHFT